MSLTDDLRGKVEAAADKLVNLAKKLDEIESLEEDLREANSGLVQVSSNISELAGSARVAQESLDATLKSLERATDAMMQLEPGTISSAIQATNTSIKAAVEGSSKDLSELVSKQAQAVTQSVRTNHETTRRQLREQAEHQAEQAQAITQLVSTNHEATQQQVREQAAQQAERQAKAVKVFKWIGSLLVTLLIVLVILATLTFINIQ